MSDPKLQKKRLMIINNHSTPFAAPHQNSGRINLLLIWCRCCSPLGIAAAKIITINSLLNKLPEAINFVITTKTLSICLEKVYKNVNDSGNYFPWEFPNLVVSKLVVCNFTRKRSFAPFWALLQTSFCTLLRALALFCRVSKSDRV